MVSYELAAEGVIGIGELHGEIAFRAVAFPSLAGEAGGQVPDCATVEQSRPCGG